LPACDHRNATRREATILETAVPGRLYRSVDHRVLAGVAHGLAQHLRLRPAAVRVAFVVLSLFGGFGGMLYIAYWAVVPMEPVLDVRRRRRPAVDRGSAVALAVLGLGVVLLLRGTPLLGDRPLLLPVLLGGAGLAVMWRQADEAQRGRWLQLSSQLGGVVEGRSRRTMLLRIGGGVALVFAGIATFITLSGRWAATRDGLMAIVVVLAGVALITGPWWWRLLSDLSTERRERIRSQERAELAAHLHDSVLQTLALIQRHVDSPREVARLARGQERELRAWLYRPDGKRESRFAAALEGVSAEVEDAYAVQVETVVVGDADMDGRLAAVVQATREALGNAARHAGVPTVSLYAEVEPDRVSVFVRDRGVGFDQDAVPDDRHGVQGSIVGRMERHGGTAAVHTAPGAGTEVELTMARSRQ
jgi:signal transduction histidine kinase/phage shock protein PspC (stress-responsive transcriptional regulator)